MATPRNTHGIVIPLAIVVVGLALGYFYYANVTVDAPIINQQGAGFERLKNLKLDLSLFEKPAFKVLKTIGEVPVVPASGGRPDPFQ